MNRIDELFVKKRSEKKTAFIAFITAGDPSLKITKELVLEFEKSGVDLIELGVPFSDPLADGPTIQASSQRALKKDVSLSDILNIVSSLRRLTSIPIVLMTYYNPVFHYGEKRFVSDAKKAGVDGLIVPDLPPEEAKSLIKYSRQKDLATIFFLSPTTKEKRIKLVAEASTGFIYYVSLAGVTGARKSVSNTIAQNVKRIRKYTKKPICVGFGVSTPEQVKSISKVADGVIVGSAIVKSIASQKGNSSVVKKVSSYVRGLCKATK